MSNVTRVPLIPAENIKTTNSWWVVYKAAPHVKLSTQESLSFETFFYGINIITYCGKTTHSSKVKFFRAYFCKWGSAEQNEDNNKQEILEILITSIS